MPAFTTETLILILGVFSIAFCIAMMAVMLKNNHWILKEMTKLRDGKKASDDMVLELIDLVDELNKSSDNNGHKPITQARSRGKFIKKAEGK